MIFFSLLFTTGEKFYIYMVIYIVFYKEINPLYFVFFILTTFGVMGVVFEAFIMFILFI
jgi:hypothetical protein